MNWEKSKSLTPLKHDFLRSFFKFNSDFFLTGGSALSIFYLDHRFSYDLDLFSLSEVNWHLVDNQLRAVCEEINASFEKISSSQMFYRYKLSRGEEVEVVDFVIEKVPQICEQKNRFNNINVDTIEEIGVNKICTLIGRSELKDLIDLYFLSLKGFDVLDHLLDAKKKDAGIEPAILSYLLDQIKINDNEMPFYLIKEVDGEDLKAFIEELKVKTSEISFPEEL